MKKRKLILFFIILISVFSIIYADNDCNCNCFTVIVGKKASLNGDVLLAHNEDDGGNIYLNIRKTKRVISKNNIIFYNKNNTKIIVNGYRQGLLWFEITNQDFGDSFVNENGVIIVSNACPSKVKKRKKRGLRYILRRLVAERAHTAREAVELMGQLVEKYGYDSSGRTYSIADKNEGWVFEIVMGKHWIAERVDDDKIAVIPNHYIIRNIELNNKKRFLFSKDIIDFAIEKGFYNPKKDGKFDFAKVYASTLHHRGNIYRHWRGLSSLSGKNFSPSQSFPFQVKPVKKISIKNLFNILEDHYEGTKYYIGKTTDPNKGNKYRPICVSSTQYSIVAELRDNLPKPISTLLWISVRKPDTSVFFPLYPGITDLPDGLGFGKNRLTYEEIIKNHFDLSIEPPKSLLYYKILKIEEKISNNYEKNIQIIKPIKEEFQNNYINIIPYFEKSYKKIYKKNKTEAQIYLDTFNTGVFYRLKKSFEKIDEKLK